MFKVFEGANKAAQKFEFYDFVVVQKIFEGLSVLGDARINDKSYLSGIEAQILDIIMKTLMSRLEEVHTFLEINEDQCIFFQFFIEFFLLKEDYHSNHSQCLEIAFVNGSNRFQREEDSENECFGEGKIFSAFKLG